jgi:hypothetical protein
MLSLVERARKEKGEAERGIADGCGELDELARAHLSGSRGGGKRFGRRVWCA